MEDKDKKKNVKKIIVYAVLLVLIMGIALGTGQIQTEELGRIFQLDKPDFSNDRFVDSKYVSVPREEELLDHSSSCNIYERRFHDLFLLCR